MSSIQPTAYMQDAIESIIDHYHNGDYTLIGGIELFIFMLEEEIKEKASKGDLKGLKSIFFKKLCEDIGLCPKSLIRGVQLRLKGVRVKPEKGRNAYKKNRHKETPENLKKRQQAVLKLHSTCTMKEMSVKLGIRYALVQSTMASLGLKPKFKEKGEVANA